VERTLSNDLGSILCNRRMHWYSNGKLREKMRRCLAGPRERIHERFTSNTAARTLERVTGPFHFMPLAGVLNDPAEQARACCRQRRGPDVLAAVACRFLSVRASCHLIPHGGTSISGGCSSSSSSPSIAGRSGWPLNQTPTARGPCCGQPLRLLYGPCGGAAR
jgi:hypothetical protein